MVYSKECFLLFGGLGLKLGDGTMSLAELQQYIDFGGLMTRIMFPFVILLTLVALMMGACNAHRRFATPALGGLILNLTVIGWGIFALRFSRQHDPNVLVIGLCWSVLAGAVLRTVLMIPTLWRVGWRWRATLTLRDPELMSLMNMMGLALVTMMFSQVNIVVGNQFAMYLGVGIKSSLVFSQRLIQFPMGLTATAVATAMLPQLTVYLLQGKTADLRNLMGFTKRLELVLINPAMIGLVALGMPIMQLLFEHGEWTHGDTQKAYFALVFSAPGLLPQGWMRLLIPLFYARKDLMTPLKAALIGMIANAVLSAFFALCTPLAQGGLALASTLSMFVNYGALAYYLRRDLSDPGHAGDQQIGETFWKSLAAAVFACALGSGLYYGLAAMIGIPASTLGRAALLFPVMLLVAVLYFATARLLHVPDSREATDLLLKKLRLR